MISLLVDTDGYAAIEIAIEIAIAIAIAVIMHALMIAIKCFQLLKFLPMPKAVLLNPPQNGFCIGVLYAVYGHVP